MASTTIVRSVTEALLGILRSRLSPMVDESNIRAAPPEEIHEGLMNQTLLLFLYQVIESPFLRNSGPRIQLEAPPVDPSISRGVTVRRGPLALDLYYLLIPGAASDGESDAYLDTYDILGAGMLAFHDKGTFTLGEFALSELAPEEQNLEFRIDFNRLDMSDLIRVWEAIQKPYRLSVSYVVRTLMLDSTRTTSTSIVSERRSEFNQS